MTFQRISRPSSSNSPTQKKASSLTTQPLAIQALRKSDRPHTRDEAEDEVFQQHRIKRPLRFDHNFANIPVNHPEDNRPEGIARPQLPASTSNTPTGLPYRLRAGVEHLSGLSMDDVKVHQNSSQPGRWQAHAYTWGTDIHIAPGQEQHLPHEAWHAVQQKQGKVKPAAFQTNEALINDDPGLEGEADQMGAKASQANFVAPIEKNNQLPVAKSVQPKVMQRKKVATDFGEFETTKFVAHDRGVEIILKFHPAESKVDAKKIALSQSAKAIKESGDAYAVDPTKATRMVARGKPGAGYIIDASGKTNNPIYFDTKNLGPTEELKDTPQSANKTADPTELGVNTQFELGYCYKEKAADTTKKKQSAGLYDIVRGRKKMGASMTFETAAFAIEGTDKDKYYGSVKWGYKMEGTAAAPTVNKMDIDLASKRTPTANFMKPAKLWNIGRTQGTLRVIADPATVVKMDLVSTETLAKDTKLKQLDTIEGGTEPMIKAEVLNPDGTGSGKLIYINVPDVKDMGDGSPNKKLPLK